jgi:hypothetical protein
MTDSNYVISIQPGYVLVEEPSDYEVVWEEQPAKLQKLAATCREADTRKVIVKGSTVNVKLSMMEILMLSKEIAKVKLNVAIITKHDLTKEHEALFKDVATNRGSPIQFFDNEKDAKDWLAI